MNELREKLETIRDMSYKGVMDDIVACLERRRESSMTGPIPMDIGAQRSMCTTVGSSSLRGAEGLRGLDVESWTPGERALGREVTPKLPMYRHLGVRVRTQEAK